MGSALFWPGLAPLVGGAVRTRATSQGAGKGARPRPNSAGLFEAGRLPAGSGAIHYRLQCPVPVGGFWPGTGSGRGDCLPIILDMPPDTRMSPGIGLMKRRLETEKDAIALAVSGIAKGYDADPKGIAVLETKYHDDAGDWYVALGWGEERAVVRMDSVLGTITEIKEI